MGTIIFLLFILFPVAEILVMIRVSALLGGWQMLGLLLLSGALGVHFARYQGGVTLVRIQQSLQQGKAPTREMVDGLLIFTGGVLFALPGFISDGLGALLLFPPTRALVGRLLAVSFLKPGTAHAGQRTNDQKAGNPPGVPRQHVQDAEIILPGKNP